MYFTQTVTLQTEANFSTRNRVFQNIKTTQDAQEMYHNISDFSSTTKCAFFHFLLALTLVYKDNS